MKHTASDLIQMQSLPLTVKIQMTERRVKEWYDYWDGDVYLGFSGGKDSTVLKHIIDSMGLDIPAVFVNTGLWKFMLQAPFEVSAACCNAFHALKPTSQPMSFWTEQDVLHYLKEYNVPYCSVYGDIVTEDGTENLKTTRCTRTGCIFCMFGCHLEKEPNRFQQLKKTHPRQYQYCINGGEYNEEGIWQPSKDGLGLGKVLDYINVKYE